MKDLIQKFQKQVGFMGGLWHLGVVEQFGNWLSANVKCESCGKTRDLQYGPDPYQSEINDDDTPVWLCGECKQEHCDDI